MAANGVARMKEEAFGVPEVRAGVSMHPMQQVEQALARQRVAPLMTGQKRVQTVNQLGTAFDLRERMDCTLLAEFEGPPMFPNSRVGLETLLDLDCDINEFDYLGEERCGVCTMSTHEFIEAKLGI